jgi:hypothetical protein
MIFAVSSPAQDPNNGNQELPQGAEALTRGPVHEAFAAPVVYNPTAGVVAVKSPPAPIEELPPDQKPEGDIVWIPGYWSWDEERQDYIWISGIWRDPPPGMTWVPGYWIEVDGGFQWTAGYWQQIETEEIEYLPEPPQSLENGPNIPQPDENHFWIPGTYVWHEARYAWQPGYWTTFQPGWVWVPARYHWTPTGYVYTAGYWDVPMEVRGVMFAPVYFTAARPVNYYYTPTIVLNIGAITTHLFCRPHRHVYVFGDYYDDRYVRAGYTPWFEFGRTRYGYDPNFVYYRHHFRRSNPDWAVTLRRNHDFIRRDESYRPPRTFREQTNIVQNITNINTTVTNTMVNNVSVNNISNNTVGRIGSVNMATPLNRAVQQNAFTNFKVAKIDDSNRRRIQTVAHQTREVSQERRQLERAQLQRLQASGAATKTKTGAVQIKQPVKMKLDQKIVNNLNAGASKIRTDAGRKTDVGRPGAVGDREVGKGGGRPVDTRPGDRPGVAGRPGDRPGAMTKPGDQPGTVGRPGDRPGVTGRPGDRPGVTGRPADTRPGMQDKPGTRPGTSTADRPGATGRPVRPGERPSGVVKQPEGRPGDRPPGVVKQPEGRPGVDPRTGQPPSGQRPGVGSSGTTGGQMKTPQPRDLPPGRSQGNTGKGNAVPGAGSGSPPIRRPPPQPDKEKEKEKQRGKTAAELNEDARRAAMRGQVNPQGGDSGRRGYPQGQGGGDAARQAQAAQQQAAQQQAERQKAAQMKAAQDSQSRARAAQDQQTRAKAAQDAQARAKAAQDQQSRAKAAQDAQQRAKAAQDQQAAEARAKAARDAQQRQQQERMKQAQKQQGGQQGPGNRPDRKKEEEEKEKEKRGKGR